MPRQTPNTYPPATLKRIKKDIASLLKEPIVNAGARPREDDITFWDAAIEVEMTDYDKKGKMKAEKVKIPLHFNIHFPSNYPAAAPSIGFSYRFNYDLGAAYVESSGILKGEFVLCLDLLGNFAGVHTEWAAEVGSGWSPAYNVGSILINLQSILSGMDESYGKGCSTCSSRRSLIHMAQEFQAKHPEYLPEIATDNTVAMARLNNKCEPSLVKLARKLKIDADMDKMQALKKHVEIFKWKRQRRPVTAPSQCRLVWTKA